MLTYGEKCGVLLTVLLLVVVLLFGMAQAFAGDNGQWAQAPHCVAPGGV